MFIHELSINPGEEKRRSTDMMKIFLPVLLSLLPWTITGCFAYSVIVLV
jgi:hypothetical protein